MKFKFNKKTLITIKKFYFLLGDLKKKVVPILKLRINSNNIILYN